MCASRWRKAWSHAPVGANELVDDAVEVRVDARAGEHGAVWTRCPVAQICCSQVSRMALESSQLEELWRTAPVGDGELQALEALAANAAARVRPRCLGATKAPPATARSKASSESMGCCGAPGFCTHATIFWECIRGRSPQTASVATPSATHARDEPERTPTAKLRPQSGARCRA